MSYKVGDRVGAILGSSKEKGIEFLGYGTYEGEHVPKEAVGWMADALRDCNIPNPKIKLDSGQVVYGCECWWGDEEVVRRRLEGQLVREVDIAKMREEFSKPSPERTEPDKA